MHDDRVPIPPDKNLHSWESGHLCSYLVESVVQPPGKLSHLPHLVPLESPIPLDLQTTASGSRLASQSLTPIHSQLLFTLMMRTFVTISGAVGRSPTCGLASPPWTRGMLAYVPAFRVLRRSPGLQCQGDGVGVDNIRPT